MQYQTLYRKYRPKKFEQIYGQKNIVKTLLNIIKNNKLTHAYLFTGPRGTGKTSSAKLFAKAVNCQNNINGDACNECDNCLSFNSNSNPDIIEIDAASNNGVDEIREIKNNVNLVPSMSKYKIYIIDEVHMLSIGAFNALLKTLEEPPEYVIFILATTEPQKIPATIISRCQRFDFKLISDSEMKNCLSNIIDQENIDIEEDALLEIINNSRGGMRDAVGLLDQAFAFSDGKITKSDIENLSGNISDEETNEFIKNIVDNRLDFILQFSEKIYSDGKDYEVVLNKVINILRENLIDYKIKQSCNLKINDTKLIFLIDELEKVYEKIMTFSNKKLIFDVGLIELLNLNISNVPRETLNKNDTNDVPRETLKPNNTNDVPRETLKPNNTNDVPRETLEKLKNIQNNKKIYVPDKVKINNILVLASKDELIKLKESWKKIKELLIYEENKMTVGLLIKSIPVAVSKEGIILECETEQTVERINNNLDGVKQIIEKIYNKLDNIICVSKTFWTENRPIYVEKMRNKTMKYISEENNNECNILNEFKEFVEMEEK